MSKKFGTDYRVCQGFRLTKQNDYFLITFDYFLNEVSIFEAAGAVAKIDSSPKLNHHNQV